jgi:hypothetical protein
MRPIQQTPYSRSWQSRSWQIYFLPFSKHNDSLPSSQGPATGFSLKQARTCIHTCTHYFVKLDVNVILPSTLPSPNWSLPLRFFDWTYIWISDFPHAFYTSRPSHMPWFQHQNISDEGCILQLTKFLIAQVSSVSYCDLSLRPQTFSSNPCSQTLSGIQSSTDHFRRIGVCVITIWL